MAMISLKTNARNEFIDITARIQNCVPPALKNGTCLVYCPHTTAGITVNENADPDVRHDLLAKLDKLIPHDESYYLHGEGNSAAHLKSTLVGVSVLLPVRSGRLDMGTWQGVYFCEFDGPRMRTVRLIFQNAMED